ncbi:MAG: radical SAM protein [Muribaculaceae bacterium]|nr:radical SAM protein [Muribaculaceae bacterium]MBR3831641.1 radical SAM protein [Muribaculaceae bacterium]
MVTILFHSTIFGPIHSRRLGSSLGVNLSPNDGKVCSFDCVYCEAGYNSQGAGTTGLPRREDVSRELEMKLKSMIEAGEHLDVITFSGNGEPTLHPQFAEIIDDTIALRDKYFPQVKISVLCNSTRLGDESVVAALRKVDNNILKLDSAITSTMRLIDQPASPSFTSEGVIEQIAQFSGQCVVQTMFLRGEHDGKKIDNTTIEEVEALIKAYKRISPRQVMIYSIDRKTPEQKLEKVSHEELEAIASQMSREGINVTVS